MHLILTGLELNNIKNNDFVCLGFWARKYDQKKRIRKIKKNTIEDPWNNRDRFFRDYKYLSELHDKSLTKISNYLNKIHNQKHSVRYWQILLDPWLMIYLSALYDRWIRIEDAFLHQKRYKVMSPKESFNYKKCFFGNEISNLIQNDEWNHNLCLEILYFKYKNSIEVIKYIPDLKFNDNFIKKKFFKKFVFQILESFINFLSRISAFLGIKPKIYLHLNHLQPFAKFRLDIALKQTPFFRFKFHINKTNIILDESEDTFRKGKIELGNSDFERFFSKRLLIDVPLEFTSSFKSISNFARAYYTPKIIVSDNIHWENTLFKHWLAQSQEKGTKVFISQHGGSLCEGMPNDMNFQEAISDKYITWSLPLSEKQIQLTPLKFAGRNFRTYQVNRNKYISYIALDRPRYIQRCGRAADSGQIFLHHKQTLGFFKGLNKISKNKFRIRPYHFNYLWGFTEEYIKYFGSSKVLNIPYYDFLSNSSIVICSYPETTFSECVFRNIPTILLYPENLFESHPFIIPTLKKLKNANIVFHDPKLASNHINQINDKPLDWWNSEEVTNAIREFREVALPYSKNWLSTYGDFLKSNV